MSAAPPPLVGTRPRLPDWLRLRLPTTRTFGQTRSLVQGLRLHTVCESARCPNQWECWDRGTATFMIAGDRCTRACSFCAIATAKPLPLDPDEPRRVAEAVQQLRLRHVVITAVARDDLADGGADHFRRTIEAVRALTPQTAIEILTPDFRDDDHALEAVLACPPDVFNHNLETVRRLTPEVRSRATYDRSLSVLRKIRARAPAQVHTKSGLMVGLGEQPGEVLEAMRDLRGVGCEMLTVGQYLQPTPQQHAVVEFIAPAQFQAYAAQARALGFVHVASGPMVRSSYHAAEGLSQGAGVTVAPPVSS